MREYPVVRGAEEEVSPVATVRRKFRIRGDFDGKVCAVQIEGPRMMWKETVEAIEYE